MKDIDIVSTANGTVPLSFQGICTDQSLQLYQRILILLLSDSSGLFRVDCGTSLCRIFNGANISSSMYTQQVAKLACYELMDQLDDQDKSLIAGLTAQAISDDTIKVTLTLTDGSQITGQIK